MELAIRSGFIAAALYCIHVYLAGPGAWIAHHVLLNVLVSGAGILMAVVALIQFGAAGLMLTLLFLRGELR